MTPGDTPTITYLLEIVFGGMWGVILVVHSRRLLRLACVRASATAPNQPVGDQLQRVWWWLGREEFWSNVRGDVLRGLQLTVLLGVLAWVWPT